MHNRAIEYVLNLRSAGRIPLPCSVLWVEFGKLRVAMVSIEPICVEIDREDDGRILASVPDLPGVMAYGGTEIEAVRKVGRLLFRCWRI